MSISCRVGGRCLIFSPTSAASAPRTGKPPAAEHVEADRERRGTIWTPRLGDCAPSAEGVKSQNRGNLTGSGAPASRFRARQHRGDQRSFGFSRSCPQLWGAGARAPQARHSRRTGQSPRPAAGANRREALSVGRQLQMRPHDTGRPRRAALTDRSALRPWVAPNGPDFHRRPTNGDEPVCATPRP